MATTRITWMRWVVMAVPVEVTLLNPNQTNSSEAHCHKTTIQTKINSKNMARAETQQLVRTSLNRMSLQTTLLKWGVATSRWLHIIRSLRLTHSPKWPEATTTDSSLTTWLATMKSMIMESNFMDTKSSSLLRIRIGSSLIIHPLQPKSRSWMPIILFSRRQLIL